MMKQKMTAALLTAGAVCTLYGGYSGHWFHMQHTESWKKVEKESLQYTEQAGLRRALGNIPDCGIRIDLTDSSTDVQLFSDTLWERWEKNHTRDGYTAGIYFNLQGQPRVTSLSFSLPDNNKWANIMEIALLEEGGDLRFMQMERIGEMDCCIFEIGDAWELEIGKTDGYHIILDGVWEGRPIQMQHIFIPYTDSEYLRLGMEQRRYLEDMDINFDGRPDLLIHEGFSFGSGGSWKNCRAITWDAQKQEFAYYPSFPDTSISIEPDRQRVVTRGCSGVSYEYVIVYEVVNGEYMQTKELVSEHKYHPESGEWQSVLSYYEMGELKQTHLLSDESEKERLYPDMDYWMKG